MTEADRSHSGPGPSGSDSTGGDPRTEPLPSSVGSEPSLEAVLRPFPHARSRGGWLDRLLFHGRRLVDGIGRPFTGRHTDRPHPRLLSAAAQEIIRAFREPVSVETGSMGAAGEGTESTASLASVLRGQGRFYSLEADEERIESCRRACGGLNQWIRYQQGDPEVTLERLRDEGELDRVHLAFLPAPDHDGGSSGIYDVLEDLMVPGSLLVVDDALHREGRGEGVRERLLPHPDWDVRLLLAGRGILVAQRRS